MRKMLLSAAALLLCAAPAAAQQALTPSQPAPVVAPAAQPAPTPEAALNPTPDHVRALVRAQEARHADQSPIGSKDWWYLVAAIAIGVIIAAVLL
jgi:hypothetical protein